jgi:hypothetical protein
MYTTRRRHLKEEKRPIYIQLDASTASKFCSAYKLHPSILQTRPVIGGKEIYYRGKRDLQRVHMAPVQHAPAPLALGDHQQVRARVDCHKFSKVSALVHLQYIKSI